MCTVAKRTRLRPYISSKLGLRTGPGSGGFGKFRADYDPILGRIARSQSLLEWRKHEHADRSSMAIPVPRPAQFAMARATSVAYASDCKIPDGPLGALDFHKFVFRRQLMGPAGALDPRLYRKCGKSEAD